MPLYSEDPVIDRLVACYRARLPLMEMGPPGYRKTAAVYQAATIIEAHPEWWKHLDDGAGWQGVLVRRLAQMVDATEFIGMPDIEANGKPDERYTVWRYPKNLPRKGCGIFFLDEYNLADQSLQAVSRQLVDSYVIGICNYTLPKGWSLVGAGNRTQDGTPVYEVDKAMERRWLWYDVPKPTREAWTAWAIQNKVDSSVITYLNYEWESAFDQAYPNVGLIKETPYANLPSWVKASDMIKANGGSALPADIMGEFALMCVGNVALKFQAFCSLRANLVHPKDAMANPDTCHIPSFDRLDQRWSMVSAIASHAGEELSSLFAPSEVSETDKIQKAMATVSHPVCVLAKRFKAEMGLLLIKMVKANIQQDGVFLKVFKNEPLWKSELEPQWGKYL